MNGFRSARETAGILDNTTPQQHQSMLKDQLVARLAGTGRDIRCNNWHGVTLRKKKISWATTRGHSIKNGQKGQNGKQNRKKAAHKIDQFTTQHKRVQFIWNTEKFATASQDHNWYWEYSCWRYHHTTIEYMNLDFDENKKAATMNILLPKNYRQTRFDRPPFWRRQNSYRGRGVNVWLSLRRNYLSWHKSPHADYCTTRKRPRMILQMI